MRPRIVFVPGFAASHLFKAGGFDGLGERLWLSQTSIAWSGIERLSASDDGAPIDSIRTRPTGVLEEVYQPFMLFCQVKGIDLEIWPYDWRGDIVYNARLLAQHLDKYRFFRQSVNVVGHSMGGLVAMKALQQCPDEVLRAIPRIITCATPWKGSFRTVELLTGKHDIVQKIVGWNRLISSRNGFQWLQSTIRTIAGWHGVYDMLPMPEMLNEYQTAPNQNPFVPGILTKVNAWIPNAAPTAALQRRPIHIGPFNFTTHYNWRGLGLPTAGPMPSVDSEGRPDFYFRALDGDGTVPAFSSSPPPAFESFRQDFYAEHEQFMNDPRVLEKLGQLIGA